MRGFIMLADAVTRHPDNTVSILRGGINRVWGVAGEPIFLNAGALVALVGGPEDAGSHGLIVRVVNDGGALVLPEVRGDFSFPNVGGTVNSGFPLRFPVPAFGGYRAILLVDGTEIASWGLTAMERPAEMSREVGSVGEGTGPSPGEEAGE